MGGMALIPNGLSLGKQGGPGLRSVRILLSTSLLPRRAISASISPGFYRTNSKNQCKRNKGQYTYNASEPKS